MQKLKPQTVEDPTGRIYYRFNDYFKEAVSTLILLIIIVIMFCVVFWLATHYAKPIEGSSMQPNINNYEAATGDIAIVSNQLRYTRDDILIIDMAKSNNQDAFAKEKLLIKRVIALPGDSIKLVENGGEYVFYIKKPSDTDFSPIKSRAQINPMTSINKATAFYEQIGWTIKPTKNADGSITIPDGYIFFVGDNRDASYDCRNFGPVEMKACVGVVEYVLYKDSFWNKLFSIINFYGTKPVQI